jgi:hypothetical protein
MIEKYAPGQQICRKKCRFMMDVDNDKDPNYTFFRELGLSYSEVKQIIQEDGGAIGFCSFALDEFVVLGIKCQNPEEYIAETAQLN